MPKNYRNVQLLYENTKRVPDYTILGHLMKYPK